MTDSDTQNDFTRALAALLAQYAGKPIFPDRRGSARCEKPRAWVASNSTFGSSGVRVQLHPNQPPDTLTDSEARRYLAWLERGNFGHHWYVENAFLNGDTDK